LIVALATVCGLLAGAVIGWALGVFVLQLPWETTLLLVQVSAVVCALVAGIVTRRRRLRVGTSPSAG